MTLTDVDIKLEEIYKKKGKFGEKTDFWYWVNKFFLFDFKRKREDALTKEEYFYILKNYKNENGNSIFTYKEFKELNNQMFKVFNLDDLIFVIENLKEMKDKNLHLNKKRENFLLFNSFRTSRACILEYFNEIFYNNYEKSEEFISENFETLFDSLEIEGEKILALLNLFNSQNKKDIENFNEKIENENNEKYFNVETNQNLNISYDDENIIIKIHKSTKLKMKR